jgi:hypothetical protein
MNWPVGDQRAWHKTGHILGLLAEQALKDINPYVVSGGESVLDASLFRFVSGAKGFWSAVQQGPSLSGRFAPGVWSHHREHL